MTISTIADRTALLRASAANVATWAQRGGTVIAFAGAAIGSFFPGPGTVIGGGVVGSSVGNKVGSFVHDRVGPAIGEAAKGAVEAVKKLKFW